MFLPVRKLVLSLLVNQSPRCCCAQPGTLKDTSSVPPASLKLRGDVLVSQVKSNSHGAAVHLPGWKGSLAAPPMGRASCAPTLGKALGRTAETPQRAGPWLSHHSCAGAGRRSRKSGVCPGCCCSLQRSNAASTWAHLTTDSGRQQVQTVTHPASNQPGLSHQNRIAQRQRTDDLRAPSYVQPEAQKTQVCGWVSGKCRCFPLASDHTTRSPG